MMKAFRGHSHAKAQRYKREFRMLVNQDRAVNQGANEAWV